MTMDMRNAQGIAIRPPAYIGEIIRHRAVGRVLEIRETIGTGALILRVDLAADTPVVPLIEEAGFQMTGHWRTRSKESARVPLRKI